MARTRWEDWYAEIDRAYEELRGQVGEIFVMGLSMGATLALRLAELRGDGVAGLVLVNPSLTADNVLARLAPLFGRVVPSVKGIGSDIKKDGAHELAYDRIPGRAAASLAALWKLTRQRLGDVKPAGAGVPQHRRPCGGPGQRADPAGGAARRAADRPRARE